MSEPETKKSLLKQVFPDLSGELLEQLSAVAQLNAYPSRTLLCQEHHQEHTFYVIQDGEVEFSKKMGADNHILRRAGAGEFFGEMALLDEHSGRSATVMTITATKVLELERAVFTELIRVSPSIVLSMVKVIVQRMRENDRFALEELQAQKEEIEQAYEALQRLDNQRNIFLTTMAHELRTPLTSVMGYMQLIRSGVMKEAALEMSLEKIGSGLDRMVSLINDLFFLQELEGLEPRFRRVDLREILEEVMQKAAPYATQQKVTLSLDLPDTMPEITAEADGLLRAFGHLIDNAIKFSPDGGEVEINVRPAGDRVVLEVIDHGIGIDPEFMPRLFMRFERDETYGKHLFGGVGLGMPIVKQIVDMHMGTIEVDSARGEGTKITIDFPQDARRATLQITTDDAWVDVPE